MDETPVHISNPVVLVQLATTNHYHTCTVVCAYMYNTNIMNWPIETDMNKLVLGKPNMHIGTSLHVVYAHVQST